MISPTQSSPPSPTSAQRLTENDLIGALNRRASKIHHTGKVKVARKLLRTRASSFAQLPSAHDTMSPMQIMTFESSGMMKAEREQRSFKDSFWGFDKQEKDCRRERRDITLEDKRSLKHELYCEYVTKLATWREEEKYEQQLSQERMKIEKEEKRMDYMRYFMNAKSTSEVIKYSWYGIDISNNNMEEDEEENPFHSNYLVQSTNDLFDLDMEAYATSPGRSTTMHVSGKLQSKIVAPSIKPETIDPNKSSVGSVSESVYMQPGSWMKRPKSEMGSTSRSSHRGKDKLLEKSQKVRSMPQMLSEPKHTDEIDGHPIHKWDQRHILRTVFTLLDKDGEGSIPKSALSIIEVDYKIQSLLRFTVLGAWVKQRKWAKILDIFDKVSRKSNSKGSGERSFGAGSEDSPQVARMTANQWVSGSRDYAAIEENVPVQRIRTDEEHKRLSVSRAQEDWAMLLDTNGSSGDGWFAESFRSKLSAPIRAAKMKRKLSRGDSVWGLHHSGCFWLPAVIEHCETDRSCYILRYPLTMQELRAARMSSSSKQFIPDKKLKLIDKTPLSSLECIDVKPFDTEAEVCQYAFDCIDTRSVGSVDVRVLLQMLQSKRYRRIVGTSYCLNEVVKPFMADELIKVVEDRANTDQQSSMVILKSEFVQFCLAIEELSLLHDRTYHTAASEQ